MKIKHFVETGCFFRAKKKEVNMIITGMKHFESVCKKKLVEWYNNNGYADIPFVPPIDLSDVLLYGVVKPYRITNA